MRKTEGNPTYSSCFALALFIALAPGRAQASGIPDRPDKLSFPPLVYEPPAPEQFRVALKSGPVAYVVPDRDLPLVNIVIYVRAGRYLEPAGKEGLASLTGYLLARGGTRSKSAEQLEERLAFLAAQLGSSINDTEGSVGLNLLSKDLAEGLAILREVLSVPRFEEGKLTLRKQQMIQAMKERNDDPEAIEDREHSFLAFGEDFWVNHLSTAASVNAITRSDLDQFHRQCFFPSNCVIAVSGDFDATEMVQKLESLFADWPFRGTRPGPLPTNTTFASPGVYLVNKAVNQGRVAMTLPGITRDNPDYFPVMIMNDILGGGGFTSRLVNRVRSDEGLAYDIHTGFPGGIYYPLTFTVGFQSKSRTVTYAASIILDELQRIRTELVADREMLTSKTGFIDRFPRNFATKAQVASTFAQDELTGRYAKDPNYWKNYRTRVARVTKEDVLAVAKKYISLDKLVTLVVGEKEEILLGQPNHPAKLSDVAGGRIIELPLRDPLTMKPMQEK